MWRMKFESLICDSHHSSLTLLWDTHTLEFLASYCLQHVTPLCWLLLMALSLSSAVPYPALSLQTFFFPGLLTWWSHTVSAVNISRLLIPNFYLTYTLSLIFLKRSLVFPILLFSSISLHWSLKKALLSLLAILW